MKESKENQESENDKVYDYKATERYLALRALIRHVAYFCAENDYKEFYEQELMKYNASREGGGNHD